jgi:hypothetical protein
MSHVITVAVYLVIILLAAAIEFWARVRPNQIAPIDTMLSHMMTSRITRVGVTAAWWWFGWHFLFAPTVQLEL